MSRPGNRPRLVADDAIACVREAFGPLGDLELRTGPSIDADVLADASVLLTRSVTRVGRSLLARSAVRMVASATAGIDHVDLEALRERGIAFAHAPGSNARAVVEYVLTALLLAAARRPGPWLASGPIGIIGFGQIGRRLALLLRALGLTVLAHDPPLQERLRARRDAGFDAAPELTAVAQTESFVELPELLASCHVVSLHVPLTHDERWRTHHLLDRTRLDRLQPGALLLNTSRGAVVDNEALQRWLAAQKGSAILDVFEHEPHLQWSLLEQPGLELCTPHIAGYTLEGKLRATLATHRAVCEYLEVEPFFDAANVGTPTTPTTLDLPGPYPTDLALLADLLGQVHDLHADDRRLRALADLPQQERAASFETLRRTYALRRELSHYAIESPPRPKTSQLPRGLHATLATLNLA